MPQEKINSSQIVFVPLSKIRPNPNEPRKYIRPGAVDACAVSMKAVGQKTPLKLRKLPDGNFELIGGQIRLLAAKKLGWEALDAIILEVTSEQAFLEAVLDNQDVELIWLDWYQSIEALMNQPPKKTQQEVAELLGVDQATVSRGVKMLKTLNKAAREAIYAQCIKTPEYDFSVRSMLVLSGLEDPARVEKALRVVIDRKMTEPEVVRFVAWIKKGGYPSEYPKKGEKQKAAGPKIDPNDPNGKLWEPLPDWAAVKSDKQWGYILNGKLDKFGAPYGIYCLLSGMMKYFQRVEKVRNPEVQIPNPFEAKLEELLEKGVREVLDSSAQEQKKYDEKIAKRKTKKSSAPKELTREVSPIQKEKIVDAQPTAETGSGPMEPPTEKELGALDNMLGEMLGKDPKEGLKKLFGDMFGKSK